MKTVKEEKKADTTEGPRKPRWPSPRRVIVASTSKLRSGSESPKPKSTVGSRSYGNILHTATLSKKDKMRIVSSESSLKPRSNIDVQERLTLKREEVSVTSVLSGMIDEGYLTMPASTRVSSSAKEGEAKADDNNDLQDQTIVMSGFGDSGQSSKFSSFQSSKYGSVARMLRDRFGSTTNGAVGDVNSEKMDAISQMIKSADLKTLIVVHNRNVTVIKESLQRALANAERIPSWAQGLESENPEGSVGNNGTSFADALDLVYEHLFERCPESVILLRDNTMAQTSTFTSTMKALTEPIGDLDDYMGYIRKVAYKHVQLGMTARAVQAFGQSVLHMIRHRLQNEWDVSLEAAWSTSVTLFVEMTRSMHTVRRNRSRRLEMPEWVEDRFADFGEILAESWRPIEADIQTGAARNAAQQLIDQRCPGITDWFYHFNAGNVGDVIIQMGSMTVQAMQKVDPHFTGLVKAGQRLMEREVPLVMMPALGEALRDLVILYNEVEYENNYMAEAVELGSATTLSADVQDQINALDNDWQACVSLLENVLAEVQEFSSGPTRTARSSSNGDAMTVSFGNGSGKLPVPTSYGVTSTQILRDNSGNRRRANSSVPESPEKNVCRQM
eukprot:Clim_evm10s149 gene=Clim_evmTU10s149